MKKILSLALAAVLVVGMVFALVACGDIASGTYKTAAGMEIEIDGNKMITDGVVYKYSVDGDKITLEFDSIELSDEEREEMEAAGMDVDALIEQAEARYEEMGAQELAFEETENGFKIGGMEYTKQ